MKLYVKNTLQGLIPLYPSDYDEKRKLKIGQEYSCKIKQDRNYEFHKKFFALINMVYKNQEFYDNIDHLRTVLTLKAGYYEPIITDKGTVYLPKSISFAKMDNLEFADFYSKMVDVVIKFMHITLEQYDDMITSFL
jgi:hypothetical protein